MARTLCVGLQTKALGPLLEWAEAVVPKKQWDRTPIFLFGTAGLRKLPHEAQQSLLIDLQDALSRSQFRCGEASLNSESWLLFNKIC